MARTYDHTHYRYAQTRQPLTLEQVRAAAPSAFAPERYRATTSERYRYIPTSAVLDALQSVGFAPVFATQTAARDGERANYTRHMIALRMPDSPILRAWRHEIEPRVILMNSHDGAGAYVLHGGAFRFYCSNRSIQGDELMPPIRVKHIGRDIIGEIVEGALELAGDLPRMLEQFDAWRGVTMPNDAQMAYAAGALALRYDEGDAPLAPAALLGARRPQDRGADLYHTYSRVQENLIGAGVSVRDVPRAQRVKKQGIRAISSVTEDVKLNRALSTFTAHIAAALGVAMPQPAARAENVIEGELVA